MGYIEGNCPKCGEKTKESCNLWVYGSPIRYCVRCKQEYLDKRWREVAIDGFDPRSTNPGLYLKATLGFGAAALALGGWLYYSINFMHSYNTIFVALAAICGIATVLFLVMLIRNKMGVEDKINAASLAESRRRLQNPEYVRKLQEYGYQIPEEFLQAAGIGVDTPQGSNGAQD